MYMFYVVYRIIKHVIFSMIIKLETHNMENDQQNSIQIKVYLKWKILLHFTKTLVSLGSCILSRHTHDKVHLFQNVVDNDYIINIMLGYNRQEL